MLCRAYCVHKAKQKAHFQVLKFKCSSTKGNVKPVIFTHASVVFFVAGGTP